MRIYQELEDSFVAELETSRWVTAGHALVRMLRLQQVTSGHVADDMGDVEEIDTAKRDTLRDMLVDISPEDPLVVFCRFRHDLEQIRTVAEKAGVRYGEVSGTTKDLTNEGMIPPGVSVLGVQLAAGGLGLDLTAARRCVYYSLGYSLGDYEQSLAMVHRPGQGRPVTYYHLIAEGTVDRRVYRALQKRKDVVESVLEELQK